MVFENVEFNYSNIAFTPTQGRVANFDHVNDRLVIKTFPGGSLVQNAPLDSPLQNEVISAYYDEYYYWTLSKLGTTGNLGLLIQKWLYNGSSVEKIIGIGNEIPLINGGGFIYNGEAIAPHTYKTTLAFTANPGNTVITLNDSSFLQVGDDIYLGPSNFTAGVREHKVVSGKSGNIITLNSPLVNGYLVNDKVTYLKNIWLFNNSNGLDTSSASLLEISSSTGSVVSIRSGGEWRNTTAAVSKSNGNLISIKGTQLFEYKPFGTGSGFQSSLTLVNTKVNKKQTVKVYDIEVDDSSVIKLQKELVYFDQLTGTYLETTWSEFNTDREFFANRVFSITQTRKSSVLFGENVETEFTATVRDQYNIPVFSRSVSVTEDDPAGSIVTGFENFITDVNGQGVSKYTTGVGLDNNTPEIRITDDITNINSRSLYVQLKEENSIKPILQIISVNSPLHVLQFSNPSNLPLVQDLPASTSIPMDQVEDIDSFIPISQITESSNSFLLQLENSISSVHLLQKEAIQDFTQVTQYTFLIFAIPTPFSVKNPINTNILVRIVSFGALTLQPSTLVFKVNNIDVSGDIQVTAFAGGLELFYNPPVNFPYNSIVTVDISIEDNDVPPNLISTFYTFSIVPDLRDPIIQEVFPANRSKNNDNFTEVYAMVLDNETGLDLSTIKLFVNGTLVNHLIKEVLPGIFKVYFQTSIGYVYDSTVSASIRIKDNSENEAVKSWIFSIEKSAGIIFVNEDPEECDPLVPINSTVCIEAFGRESGIHINSTSFIFNDKAVVFALTPKVRRKN